MSGNEWEELAGFVFQTRVRSKHPPRTRGGPHARHEALKQIARVTRRAPEVIVKVTGGARGFRSLKEHLAYITRNGKLLAETGDGGVLEGSRNVKDLAEAWWSGMGRRRRRNTRDTINLILSMPPGTDRKAVSEAAREFARETFGGRNDYLIAIHEDTDHPHAHVTVKTRGLDGRRLDPRKADLQAWRESFADALRRHGVEAAATPRRSRGVVRKAKRQARKHLEARGASRYSLWNAEHAVAVARGIESPRIHEWEPLAYERQRKVRRAWATIAQIFEANGEVALALQVKQFLAGMPAIATEREVMLAKAQQLVERRLQQQGRGGPTR